MRLILALIPERKSIIMKLRFSVSKPKEQLVPQFLDHQKNGSFYIGVAAARKTQRLI